MRSWAEPTEFMAAVVDAGLDELSPEKDVSVEAMAKASTRVGST
jgi:hypothetical protein